MKVRLELMGLGNAMAEFTAPHCVAIYGVIKEGSCALNGTATLVEIEDRAFLLSAYHVLKDNPNFQYYGHSAGACKPPQRIKELDRHEDRENDVVLVEVIPEAFHASGKTPLSSALFAYHVPSLATSDPLVIHGYPGKYSEPMPPQKLINTTLPAVVFPVEENRRASGVVTVNYDLKDSYDANGKKISLPEPDGLSGSSLWYLNWNPADENWKPSDARIIGVIKHCIKESDALDAAPNEHLHALISQLN